MSINTSFMNCSSNLNLINDLKTEILFWSTTLKISEIQDRGISTEKSVLVKKSCIKLSNSLK